MTSFFVTNFPLFCICIAMAFMAASGYHNNKKLSIDIIAVLLLTLVLSVVVYLEDYFRVGLDNKIPEVFMSYLGYVIRPVCLYFFVRMADKNKIIPVWVFVILLSINAVLYMPSLFVGTSGEQFAFYYLPNADDTRMEFHRGTFNFASHIVSGLLLAYVIYISFKLISLNHKEDGAVILTCSAFVVIAVILESLDLGRNLLNIIIAASCVFYYLFINRDRNRKDALTDLFNRKTFYEDTEKFGKRVIGVIQIDMNGLKYINDTKGHEAGDNAIKHIAQSILSSIKKDMSAYRMGGDEFLILSTSSSEDNFLNVQSMIRKKVEDAGYFCSLGFCYRHNNENFDELMKKAEEWMYHDKAEFYKTHKIERRR